MAADYSVIVCVVLEGQLALEVGLFRVRMGIYTDQYTNILIMVMVMTEFESHSILTV